MLLFCRQTISCYYVVNETQTVAFSYKPRSNDPTAEVGSGQLMVQMRLAQGGVDFKRPPLSCHRGGEKDADIKCLNVLSNGILLQIHHTSSSTTNKIIQ